MNPKTHNPISRNAKHVLTDEEKEQNTETMLAAMQTAKELEAEKKDVQNSYKTKIAEQELVIDKISNLLRVGYEIRPFNCYLVKNFDSGKREYFEMGSDKLIDSEPLNAADYQTEMDITEANIKANNEADQLQNVIDEKVEEAGFTPEQIEAAEAGPDIVEPTQAEEGGIIEEAPLEPEESPFDMDEHEEEDSNPFDFDDI